MEEDTIQSYRPTTYDNIKQIKHQKIPDEKFKEHTNGSIKNGRVAYAIVIPECKIKKSMRSQNTIDSAEQEAIMKVLKHIDGHRRRR
jgi:hypothetical protein